MYATTATGEATSRALERYPILLQKLLTNRGLVTHEAADAFLHPDFERDTHDPFLLMGMEPAVLRIKEALAGGEHIAIYSDYDMDGIPGAVVLSDFFKRVGHTHVTHYIPNRNTEGFGLHAVAFERLASQGVTLVITVDCGIRGVKEIAHANELGVDVIVTDHHVPGDKLPDAVVTVNPMQEGDTYPNKSLCGAGVAFKLVQALSKAHAEISTGSENWSLDMVAAATISDMVSVVNENRALVHFGLTVFRKSARPGIRALCKTARLEQAYVTEDDIMFSIAPRINAASRMGRAEIALQLLTTTSDEEARMYARELEALNRERKGIVASMIKHMRKVTKPQEERTEVLLIGDPRWQPGLLGLAATRAVELYNKPVCVWGRGSASVIKGSCRGNGSINIVSLLESAVDVLDDYGGHRHSGGFSIRTEHIHRLREVFDTYPSTDTEANGDEPIAFDAALDLADVSWETYGVVERLAPFGVENIKPTFLFTNIHVVSVRRFGTSNAHLELMLESDSRESVKAVRFFADKALDARCELGTSINLKAQLERSFFSGTPELRLRIVAIV